MAQDASISCSYEHWDVAACAWLTLTGNEQMHSVGSTIQAHTARILGDSLVDSG